MNPDVLLAKSQRRGQRVTLEEHSNHTEHAAWCLFDPARRGAEAYCRFFRIAPEDHTQFVLNVRVAALFHDLGKANEDFLAAVTSKSREAQALRHEHLSALLLNLPEVRAWLTKNPLIDHDVITAAVLSHHIKASRGGDDYEWCKPRGKTTLATFLRHPEVVRILEKVSAVANLDPPPALPSRRYSRASPWEEALTAGMLAAKTLSILLKTKQLSVRRHALLIATKAGVILADSVASASIRGGMDIKTWIDDVVHLPPLTPDELYAAVIGPRIEQIEERSNQPFSLHSFQLAIAEQGPRALLLAACGAGKTLGAWKWAEARVREQPIGRVIFLYPTRGTATEGFRDYVAAAPKGEAALVHGTSKYEIESMRENPADEAKAQQHGLSEAEQRLYGLGLWSRRYFSATVDQFLGFLEHVYGSMCLLPALADAAVIIDEVHSFDKHMFEALLALLDKFDVPILCMTATLPPVRRIALEKAGLVAYPRNEHRHELEDLEQSENHPRYRIESLRDEDSPENIALDAYRTGKRVLWVVNQVRRAQAVARRLAEETQQSILCYHSRFKLADRQDIHRATVDAFQQKGAPALAVTTQVCEMSLDLDADVLITELAPISSLVQRFGRANRKLAHGPNFRARIVVLDVGVDCKPYKAPDLIAAREFLQTIAGHDVSQRQLADALEKHAQKAPQPRDAARFLTQGYFATPGEFRDVDDFSRPCILNQDLAEAKALFDARKPIDGFVVPVPRGQVLPDDDKPSWLPAFYSVANADDYDKQYGFEMRRRGDEA